MCLFQVPDDLIQCARCAAYLRETALEHSAHAFQLSKVLQLHPRQHVLLSCSQLHGASDVSVCDLNEWCHLTSYDHMELLNESRLIP